MKKYLFVLLTFLGLTGLPGIFAQELLKNLDSVPMTKPRIAKAVFMFTDNGNRKISLTFSRIECYYLSKESRRNEFGLGLFSAVTGVGVDSEVETYFRIPGIISCNDALPVWNVSLCCQGRVNKRRERVYDDEGSWSIETKETNIYYWDKESRGFILEGKDTIGEFLITLDPLQNELFQNLPPEFRPLEEKEPVPERNFYASWLPENARDFGVIGTFRGRRFAMVHTGYNRKVWIFEDEVLFGIYQPDLMYRGLAKKHYIKPCLFINPYISSDERRDLFRIAMVSKVVNGAIGNRQ